MPPRWLEKPTHRVCNHCEGAGKPVSAFAPSRWFEKPTHRVFNHCEGAGEAREWPCALSVVCRWQQTRPTHRVFNHCEGSGEA
jgi:hypothetical protein